MRRQLNTVYVTTEGAWLRKDGENLVMELEREERARIPIHLLEGLVCFGRVALSPSLMGHCLEKGVAISHLSAHGRFLARVEGPVSGNVLLRREQYRCSDDPEKTAEIVQHLLVGKTHNQRTALVRGAREAGVGIDRATALRHAADRVGRIPRRLLVERDIDRLRGLEGDAAQTYFSAFDHLIRVDEPRLRFAGRNRRPPRDPVNALLSFFYTLLTHDVRSALETVGLDPAVGFLHRDRPGRPSLALDLSEELRPVLADRLTLSMINRRQLSVEDFHWYENGAVMIEDGARKRVLTAYQERKREELTHAFLEERIPLGLVPYVQAQLLARHLRGDLNRYPPFLWR